MIETGQTKADDLISMHWEWVKDKIDKDNIKYSDKYSKEQHVIFINEWIDVLGFDEVKVRLLYVIKHNEILHVV